MDIADVLLKARERKGWTKAEAARRQGVSRQTINDWESGKGAPTRKRAPQVAKIYGIPVSSLTGDPEQANVDFLDKSDLNVRRVPLLDWVDAGRGAELAIAYPIEAKYKLVETTVPVAPISFALTVRGDSMEPDFHAGDVIVIDPTVEPRANDFVVAELQAPGESPGPGEYTFKQYRSRGKWDGGTSFDLIPLNAEYPTITINKASPGRVLGVVVEHRRKLRR